MTLDAEAVLFALQLHDPYGGGVCAGDVARLMSKDTTLTDHYSTDEVAVVLEALVAEGALICTSQSAGDDSAPATLYRCAASSQSVILDTEDAVADDAELRVWDDWSAFPGDDARDLFPESPATALRLRVDDLKSERDALIAERDALIAGRDAVIAGRDEAMRERDSFLDERDRLIDERDQLSRRAETAEYEVASSNHEVAELHVRVRELQKFLQQERDLNGERSETIRQVAAALTQAQEQLDRLATSDAEQEPSLPPTLNRRTMKGNWLK